MSLNNNEGTIVIEKGSHTMKSYCTIFGIWLLMIGFLATSGDIASADFAFGTPVNLGANVNSPINEACPYLSPDGLTLYFYSGATSGVDGDIWVSTRPSRDAHWGPKVNVGPPVNTASIEVFPILSDDGLTLHFASNRPGGYGWLDIYVTTRATSGDSWSEPASLGPVINDVDAQDGHTFSADGLTMYFCSCAAWPGSVGGCDLWVSSRSSPLDPWGKPANLGPLINSAAADWTACLSRDGRWLFFGSERPNGFGGSDLWATHRTAKDAPWEKPVNLGPRVNSVAREATPHISADACTLVFWSNRPGGYGGWDLWEAPVVPIVDFNGDGTVDGKEVLAMADNWGQGESACDIGPTALGDGVVDVNDLAVLAEYVGQEVNDPTLIAHWALDEAEGMSAADSVGQNNLMVLGNAAWEPASGKVGGALAFDGKDDFARSAKAVLDPSQGPFSVIAWVKGGAANRVIVSQAAGADWLYLNQYGMLTTDLKASGKDGKSLTSSAFILDDQWHRVALVWDGTNRSLHMDGVEVAKDTQPSLAASSGSMHIGGGKNLNPATFWSGLIDNVRVYNRAVQP